MAAEREFFSSLEPEDARRAFEDYYALGRGRSYAKLINYYKRNPELGGIQDINVIKSWARSYEWEERCLTREVISTKTQQANQIEFRNYRMERIRQWDKVIERSMDMIDLLESKINLLLLDKKLMTVEQIDKLMRISISALEAGHKYVKEELGESAETNQESERVRTLINIITPLLPPGTTQAITQEFNRMLGVTENDPVNLKMLSQENSVRDDD